MLQKVDLPVGQIGRLENKVALMETELNAAHNAVGSLLTAVEWMSKRLDVATLRLETVNARLDLLERRCKWDAQDKAPQETE